MNIPKVTVKKARLETVEDDLLIGLVWLDREGTMKANEVFLSTLAELQTFPEFAGKAKESLLLYQPYNRGAKLPAKRLLFVGLGNPAEIQNEAELYELCREIGGSIAKICATSKVQTASLVLPPTEVIAADTCGRFLVEGMLLGGYSFTKYKNAVEDSEKIFAVKKIEVHTTAKVKKVKNSVDKAINGAIAVHVARDMANEPGNGWTPSHFADYAKKLAKNYALKCTVFDKNALSKMGMGGILAVNKGSKEPPKLVVLEYSPREGFTDTIMLVGKGLTFDSGGISLKPAQGMMEMKFDMCGGAAVLAAMEAVGREQPGVRVVAIVPSTDNMSGGGALKPGDIITHYGGVTSEIENTDAEGRLILADALAYGVKKYQPTCIVDLATLTGAIIIALGHHHSGLMCNNDNLAHKLLASGKAAAEPLWRMPLGVLYAKQLKSDVADLKNTGGRPGGSITAAEYLHRFVGETPWAHLDIAGTAWDFSEKSYIPKGPSGFGVRLLIELIRTWDSGLA
jgi:leucyl aminopeptidase